MEAFLFLGLFAVLTIVMLIAIWRALKARGPHTPPRDPEKDPVFRIGLWIVAIASFLLVMIPDARAGQPAPKKPKPQRIILSTDHCPPPADGYGPVLVFIIAMAPDGKPLDYTCARIARRNYQPAVPAR
jgi:hypothetical protein